MKQIIVGGIALFLMACQHDYYETGDSELSYLHTDFVEATTNAASAFTKAVTDDGIQLQLSPAISASWATTPDSTYRSLLYYNKIENGITEPVAIGKVYVLTPKNNFSASELHTDPLTLESAWKSKNDKYINLSVIIKTGIADDPKASQTISLISEGSTTQTSSIHRAHHLRLLHNQNSIPQYYSTKVYISIPLASFIKGDAIYISTNTYNGQIKRSFVR